MWRISIVGALVVLGLSACKLPQMTEAEEMAPSVAEDYEAPELDVPATKNGDAIETGFANYSLPQVVELVSENGQSKLKVRVNGNCKVHRLNWVKKKDCVYELQDPTKDKCLGYQFMLQDLPKNISCEILEVNGVEVKIQ